VPWACCLQRSLSSPVPYWVWRNHGQYVRCVAQDAATFVEAGLFTQDEADALVSSSAQTYIGKKNFVLDPGQWAE
jgi:hypothetical protein